MDYLTSSFLILSINQVVAETCSKYGNFMVYLNQNKSIRNTNWCRWENIVKRMRRFVDVGCVIHWLKELNRCWNCGGNNWSGPIGVWCWHSSKRSHEDMCCMNRCPLRECNHSVYADHCRCAHWTGGFEAPHRVVSDEQLTRGRYICCVLRRIVPVRLARSTLQD